MAGGVLAVTGLDAEKALEMVLRACRRLDAEKAVEMVLRACRGLEKALEMVLRPCREQKFVLILKNTFLQINSNFKYHY